MLKLPSLSFKDRAPSGRHTSSPLRTTTMADNYIPSSFNRSTWQDQGKKNVEDTASTGSAHERKYRSAAIQCEIKLTEALSR
jgi:hypothetical protein